ncbi:STAS/SEC14 domain-containing protein [Nocardiopsis sp. CNT312]|uniref:STAS/SEC14 domain-containing protein n=1 Tax=Nocardiopsis sp. CNT312 TaxID=1137268 RepID=UPI00048B26C4|nr:STAS/SEC14 domain-containing protein [Nocardiopsis sp. CNT312]
MLERIIDVPKGIDALKAHGEVTRTDYETVIEPIVDEARREGHRIRMLCEFGPEFRSFTPGAAWEDFKVGMGAMRLFEGCAVVTDTGWIRESTRLGAFLVPCPVRLFDVGDRDEALRWLASLPEGPGVSHRMDTESRVLVVELEGPLRAQDFDALAQTADSWIASHGELAGLVVHSRDFPGWENVSGLLHHARFVRDHHKRIRRVALAADSRLADLMPRLADHFVEAELRHFDHDDLTGAVAWASGRSPAGD